MLAIIGGSGFYQLNGVHVEKTQTVDTPFGAPSAPLTYAKKDGNDATFIFLPRHGNQHSLLPSEINYRANLFALKQAGVKQIISVSAVGSLQPTLKPGDFIIPNQYIDWTKGKRQNTFFGNGLVAHISTANTVCPHLSQAIYATATAQNHPIHTDKTYICVEGPRLGTRAESLFFKNTIAADIVGMTNLPEAFLAREAQICYATLSVVTDFDCWQDDPAHHVTVADVIANFGKSIDRAKQVVNALLDHPIPIDEAHRQALQHAVLTPEPARTPEHNALLQVLLA